MCHTVQPKRSKHLPSAAKHQGSAPTAPAQRLEVLPRRNEPPRNSTHAGRHPGRTRAPEKIRSTIVVASELPSNARTRPVRSASGGRCKALEDMPGLFAATHAHPPACSCGNPARTACHGSHPIGATNPSRPNPCWRASKARRAREAPPEGSVLTAQPPHVASESTAQCLQVSRALAFSAMRPRPPALPDRRAALNATPNPPRTSRPTLHPSGHVVRDREPGSGGDALTNAPPPSATGLSGRLLTAGVRGRSTT